MASGFLGKGIPAAATWQNIYTIPSGKLASFTINACNQSGTALVDFVVSTSASYLTLTQSEYLEYQANLPGQGSTLERTGIVSDATYGKYVWVRSTTGNVSFQVYGYEE